MNIAMWSGPRNLSTAMMYAFGQRADCAVWDEPFYAAYLRATGIDHPMADEVMARYETDPARIARACAGPAPAGSPVFYQKHMTHHMVPGFGLDWMRHVRNVFLIRHPARVLASYDRKRENARLEDIGLPRQTELFEKAWRATSARPVVIDSADVRRAPEAMLRALCGAIGLDFDPAMLRWPSGGRAEDGIWAAHWYGAVHRSTGFAAPEGDLPEVPPHLRPVLDAALPHYETLKRFALGPPFGAEDAPDARSGKGTEAR